jgi:hypothetical protein
MTDTREALARLLMDWGCDDESAGQCADEILAEFLVVSRSEVVVESDRPWDPARHRETWAGPWSPLPENGEKP